MVVKTRQIEEQYNACELCDKEIVRHSPSDDNLVLTNLFSSIKSMNPNIFESFNTLKEKIRTLRIFCFMSLNLRTHQTTRRISIRLRARYYAIQSHNTLFRPFCTIFIHSLYRLTFLVFMKRPKLFRSHSLRLFEHHTKIACVIKATLCRKKPYFHVCRNKKLFCLAYAEVK